MNKSIDKLLHETNWYLWALHFNFSFHCLHESFHEAKLMTSLWKFSWGFFIYCPTTVKLDLKLCLNLFSLFSLIWQKNALYGSASSKSKIHFLCLLFVCCLDLTEPFSLGLQVPQQQGIIVKSNNIPIRFLFQ